MHVLRLLETQPACDLRLRQPVRRQPGRAHGQVPENGLRLRQPVAFRRQQRRHLPPRIDARKRIGLQVALHDIERAPLDRQAHQPAGQPDLPRVARPQGVGQFQRLARKRVWRLIIHARLLFMGSGPSPS
ncbi:hypothetical protein D3C72_2001340 [compost metagenome]